MNNQLEEIGAGRTPDGYVLDLELENFSLCRVWINESFREIKGDTAYFSYGLEFEYNDVSGNHTIEINRGFSEFESLYKCITDFKEFARKYLWCY